MWFNLLVCPFVVGVLTVLTGVLVSYFLQRYTDYQTPPECAHWNDHHIMEIALFITGFMVHLLTTSFYLYQGILQ